MRPSIRFEVFKRDQFVCLYCGRRSPDVVLEVDHVVARANGGGDEMDNLVTSCVDCNRGKGSRPLDRVPPLGDLQARTEELVERERQIAEHARWLSVVREREDRELAELGDVFAAIPSAVFTRQDGDERWCWQEPQARQFLRRLGYHDVRDMMEATAVAAWQWERDRDPASRASRAWRYFCGCCWRAIKKRGDGA